MNSSGIKRGLATTAISALAVTGLPFLATSASATPIADTLAAGAVDLYTPQDPGPSGISTRNDGTNTTVSLVAGGGSAVTSVIFQYSTDAGVTWTDVPGGNVARNADGVFAAEWTSPPATANRVRAVAGPGGATDAAIITVLDPTLASSHTVELATEGSRGVFQEPYTDGGTYDATTSELVGVTGTVSEGSPAPSLTDRSHGTPTTATDTAALDPEPTPATTDSDTFVGILDIDGYLYSGGAEANQIAIGAATDNTDDAEGSTLYVQTIGSISATPATQDDVSPADSTAVITVLDTLGKPVAGAEVYRGGDTDTDVGGPDTDADGAEELVGYTNGRGQIVADPAFGPEAGPGAAGTETYYVNTTNTNAYEAGTDPKTDVTVTTYTPTLGEVDIVNERNRSNFDLDELVDGDDFTVRTKDQKGNPFDENLAAQDVEYRWVIDPAGAATAVTSPWIPKETDVNGKATVDGLTDADYAAWSATPGAVLPEGSYKLEARRPNVGGTGLKDATPETVNASESEITFDEGNSANAPVNGSFTATGKLANDDGALAGRAVKLTYAPGVGNDAAVAPQAQQPAGVTVTGANTATAVTGADGSFSVVLRDPAIPNNVTPTPESGTLNAKAEESTTDATTLQGVNGVDDPAEPVPPAAPATIDNAEEYLTINWRVAPVVTDISIAVNTLNPRDPANAASTATPGPGVPVDLDITVFQADGPDAGSDPDPAGDVPVEVSVDKGFLSPNAETANDVVLDAGHDETGDLWGFLKDDGASETIRSTESGVDTGKTGIVAAIERDAGFDDDGLVTLTVTVKSGSVTKTQDITMDSSVLTNMGAANLDEADGEPVGDVPVTEEVDFQLYTEDQFGNLAREYARISDDSTVADFRTDEDFDGTESDYTTSGPGITAFSPAPTVQTLTATMSPGQITVNATDDPVTGARTVTTNSDPINWVEPAPVPPVPAGLTLRGGDNGAADDSLLANAIGKTEGATVKLFRKRADGTWNHLENFDGVMNSKGNFRFEDVPDLNGNRITRYKAVVMATAETNRGVGKKKVR